MTLLRHVMNITIPIGGSDDSEPIKVVLLLEETSKDLWPTFLLDVRYFIQCCPICQRVILLQAVIEAPRYVLSTVSPMTRIAIDTIGPFPTVIINTFIISVDSGLQMTS